jgi:hypothetical protein
MTAEVRAGARIAKVRVAPGGRPSGRAFALTITHEIRLELRCGEVGHIPRCTHGTLRCVAGALWITRGNDTGDYVLESGEAFQLERARAVQILAMTKTQLVLSPHKKEGRAL